jgi:hypothetical protein
MVFSRTIRTPLARIPALRGICDVLSGIVVFEWLPFSMACSHQKCRSPCTVQQAAEKLRFPTTC